jgi:hypothetical protein
MVILNLGMVAAEGELYVQIWLKSGDEAVELEISVEREGAGIPEELLKFL